MPNHADYQYDFFIAYAEEDANWVHGQFLPALGWFPGRIISPAHYKPGTSIIKEMERCITSSQYIALILSPASDGDTWSSLIGLLSTHLETAEQGNRLIPIVAQSCDIPLHLDFRVKLDFTDKANWADEIERLRSLPGLLGGRKAIRIPFVVAAMTRNQADDLISGTIIEHDPNVTPAQRSQFCQFKQALLQYFSSDDLVSCYGEYPDDWAPLFTKDISLSDEADIESCLMAGDPPKHSHMSLRITVQKFIEQLDEDDDEQKSTIYIEPDFSPSRSFCTEDEKTRRKTLTELRRSGGVLIVDAVSMFHPTLRECIFSGIGGYPRVAVFVLSPINTGMLPFNRPVQQVIGERMQTAMIRFEEEFDCLCQLCGLDDLRVFRHRLASILPEILVLIQSKKANPANIQRLGLSKRYGGKSARLTLPLNPDEGTQNQPRQAPQCSRRVWTLSLR